MEQQKPNITDINIEVSNMTWEYVLKAPWVQNIDFKSHDAPRIGRYIKYLENLLDENNRNSFLESPKSVKSRKVLTITQQIRAGIYPNR